MHISSAVEYCADYSTFSVQQDRHKQFAVCGIQRSGMVACKAFDIPSQNTVDHQSFSKANVAIQTSVAKIAIRHARIADA